VLDELLDTVPVTQRVGVAVNQTGEENHSIRVNRYGFLALWNVGSATHEGNGSVLDPDGLAFDKLPGKRVKESSIDENGIRRCIAGNSPITHHPLIHLIHIQRITNYRMGVKARRGVREALGNPLNNMPGQMSIGELLDGSREVDG
jgi:hypothetical protein